MRKALGAAVAALLTLVLVASPADARSFQVGLYDEAETLFGAPEETFPILADLGVEVLRLNLYWYRVAPFEPSEPANPASINYDWDLYDRTVLYAQQYGIELLLSIYGTPDWANGDRGYNVAPSKMTYLRAFALAAAGRYSGKYRRSDGVTLPRVRLWVAWNEPNSPTFLKPQWARSKGRYIPVGAQIYAEICNAVWSGVHAAGREARVEEVVACGATNPKGNNVARGGRPSISPLLFLKWLKRSKAKFDVYAHHPYAPTPLDGPEMRPRARTTISLGNIGVLLRELRHLYGPAMKLWITEYAYQTNPPDSRFGVSFERQAQFLRRAYTVARKHTRIGMMLWFLLRDELALGGWQSGLFTFDWKVKPAYDAFKDLPK